MSEVFSRTELLFGADAVARLRKKRVAVFGLGGVGGHLAEALARSGVGALDLIDGDDVTESNLNRQLFAVQSTLGMAKVDAAARRIADAAPDCTVRTVRTFFLPETAADWDFSQYDYVADAVDTVAAKIELVLRCQKAGVPILCAMGAGNKLDPTLFRVAKLSQTRVCPLARVMRTELRKRGADDVRVVYSEEPPRRPAPTEDGSRPQTGSAAFVPSVMGLIMAGEIVRFLADIH